MYKRQAEELLALGAHRAAHIVGDQGQVLGAQSQALFQEMGQKCKGILAIFRLNRLNQAVIVYFLARR